MELKEIITIKLLKKFPFIYQHQLSLLTARNVQILFS